MQGIESQVLQMLSIAVPAIGALGVACFIVVRMIARALDIEVRK